jgi:hypothetical protein
MRFLGIGDCCDLGAVYLHLIEEGHEVKVFIGNPLPGSAGRTGRTGLGVAGRARVDPAAGHGFVLIDHPAHPKELELKR